MPASLQPLHPLADRRSVRAEEVEPSAGALAVERAEEALEVLVPPDVDEVPVVDARAPHGVLVDAEPERPDEVERRRRRGRQARDR